MTDALGSGDGRVYTIEVSCQAGGIADTETVEVRVPHNPDNQEH
jgi:hypothetical protein